jgi:hypothetical protein
VLLGVQIRQRCCENAQVFAGAANHGVAEVAEQPAHLARAMVVVHHQPLARLDAADGAAPLLLDAHGGVVLKGNAVFGLEVNAPRTVRIPGVSNPALCRFALLAVGLYAITADSVPVEFGDRFP